MRYVPLGNTGLEVSRICYGTLTLGPLQANLPLKTGAELIAYAIGRGVNFFDTAQLYGTYGYLREGMRLANRFDCVISTKTYAYTRELASKAVEEARKALDRDYIDIFMLHEQESEHTLNGHKEALDYLFECREKGIVRAVGASMHHVAAVYGAIQKRLDVIHPLINAQGLGIVDGTREDMEKAILQAHNAGVGVFAMKALGGGNLFKRAEECLSYAFGLTSADSVAIGMQSQDEIDANIRFLKTGAFSPCDKETLAQKRRLLHIDDWCKGCGVCVKRCQQNAMRVENGRAVCAHEKCVLCGYCSADCPEWAVKVI